MGRHQEAWGPLPPVEVRWFWSPSDETGQSGSLWLNDADYRVTSFPGGWHLANETNGEKYVVTAPNADVRTWACDCGDFTYRHHRRSDGLCKHLKALFEAGVPHA